MLQAESKLQIAWIVLLSLNIFHPLQCEAQDVVPIGKPKRCDIQSEDEI